MERGVYFLFKVYEMNVSSWLNQINIDFILIGDLFLFAESIEDKTNV